MSIYTKESLRTFFQSTFNLEEWYSFLQNFFIASELKSTPEEINTNNNDKGFYLGNIQTEDSYRIGLFHYKINNGSVANKRVGLRNLVKTFINPNWGEFDAALVVFNSDDNWRFSFICDIKEESTAAKRYTYVFGNKDLLYRTPIERFIQLQKKGISFENIKTAFSVEALSNEFFDKYREQYADFIQYITGKRFVKVSGKWVEKVLSKPNDDLMNAFNNDEKLIRDYIKKMMGRITFLHFLQRKGWMNGDLNYMQNMFENSPYKENYLDTVLEPLFFGILNTIPKEREKVFNIFSWDKSLLAEWKNIPYLNGGLFELTEDDKPKTIFPAEYFQRLFDFFSEYNFTIDENDPNDAEVGVDPEMLGKIFENLLEDNKDKGAFYTPKEIVQYMCQESLIAYLETNTSLAKDKIRNFVLMPEEGVLDIPENKKEKLQKALEEVKICDPAIGSGAFPMGLLNELLHCREVLSGEYYDRAEIKKSIIKNNIYGVDIEKGAVDIARLRFWLSIVVDENTPTPLPNLDYKIMQGNSLIESYQGVDLSNLTYEKKTKMDGYVYSMFDDEKDIYQKEVSNLLSKYYSCSDHKEKYTLQRRISNVIHKLIKSQGYESILSELQEMNLAENNKFFLWHTWFSDVFNREEGKNGFDIVIGNPPYIQLQDNHGKLAEMYKNQNFSTFARTGDIYSLFYEQGINLLKEKGVLTLITSNKWMRAGYGEKLREFFYKLNPIKLIDLGSGVFENATVDTNILIVKKEKYSNSLLATSIKTKKKDLSNLEFLHTEVKDSEIWTILNPIELSIKKKIESVGTPLKDWDINIYRGVLTGCNEAFIISGEKKKEILDNCQTEDERKRTDELIRPILRGRDIKRYSYDFADLWLIYIPWHFPLHNDNSIKGASLIAEKEFEKEYQSVYNHLIGYKTVLSNRNKAETGIRYEWYVLQRWGSNYWEEFSKQKIAWASVGETFYSFIDENYCLLDTNYFFTSKDINYLIGILNSKLIKFWINSEDTKISESGAYRHYKYNLERLNIPLNNTPLTNEIKNYSLKKEYIEIDKIVYKIYNINDEEKCFIENNY